MDISISTCRYLMFYFMSFSIYVEAYKIFNFHSIFSNIFSSFLAFLQCPIWSLRMSLHLCFNLWDSKHLFKTILSLIRTKKLLQLLVLYVVQFLIFHFSSIFLQQKFFLKNYIHCLQYIFHFTYILNIMYILHIYTQYCISFIITPFYL